MACACWVVVVLVHVLDPEADIVVPLLVFGRLTGVTEWFLRRAKMNQVYILAVAAGGALGSVLRYLVGITAGRAFGTDFPWGTLIINVTGSFLIGTSPACSRPSGICRKRPESS
jgi:hypothetical protein